MTPKKIKQGLDEIAARDKDVADALNSLGVSTRDIIAIFQAMERLGALRAEIIYQ